MIESRLDPPKRLVEIIVDGRGVAAPDGSTILEACRSAGEEQPTLCYLENLTPVNTCRVCVVEVEGSRALVPACSRPISAGMEISTDSDRVRHSRRMVFELLATSVDLSLVDDSTRAWMEHYGVDAGRYGDVAATVAQPVKVEDDLYIRDYAKCILCYKCVEACGADAQNTFAINVAGRGFEAMISTEFDVALPDSACVYCGNCIGVCPTGALMFKSEFDMRAAGTWNEDTQTVTTTICPYCGVGCNLELHVQDNTIVKVTSPLDHSTTEGHLCIKGRFGFQHVQNR
jgi:predicted molibdopterin-dependent oxidoreductase YjgC